MRLEEELIEKLPRRSIPRVLVVHGRYQGPNLWRCWWPCGFLSSKGFVADFASYERFDEQHGLLTSGRYNMLITPRIAFSNERAYAQWYDMVQKLKLTWVYDSDDDLWSPEFPQRQVRVFEGMPEDNMSLDEYETERMRRIYVLRRVHAVTVTTPNLAEIASKHTSAPVHILPNLINVAAFESSVALLRRDVPPLTIGWSGTRRQEDDLEKVAAAWRIVSARFPDVKFIVQGYQSPALCSSVPIDRIIMMRGVSTDVYPSLLRNIDIACCAVSEDPWNEAKSPIKWFEASLAGSVCVVSKSLYGQYIQHGTTGYVADTVDEWVDYLSRLVQDDERRRQMQQNARSVILAKHSLQTEWPSIVLTWANAVDRSRKIGVSNAANTRTESEKTVVGA